MGTVRLDTTTIGTFTPDVEGTSGTIYLDTSNIGTFTLGASGYVYLDTTVIGSYVASSAPEPELPPEALQDPRYRTKVYLNQYLTASNLTKDDGSTYVSYIIAFGDPEYPILKVFKGTKNIDLVFSIDTPDSTPLMQGTRAAYGYNENVPIKIFCINKSGITGTKLRWKAEVELRRIAKEHPEGSIRSLDRLRSNEKNYGGFTLYSVEYVLSYKRSAS